MMVKVAHSKQELDAIMQLRYQVLRQPWGQTIDSATDEREETSINAYISDTSGLVIACGRLQQNTAQLAQIRFMAVDNSQQGKGLGRMITKALEEEGRKLGVTTIQLQARENAVEFYKSCGYSIKEKTFLLWGQIQHYLMEKEL